MGAEFTETDAQVWRSYFRPTQGAADTSPLRFFEAFGEFSERHGWAVFEGEHAAAAAMAQAVTAENALRLASTLSNGPHAVGAAAEEHDDGFEHPATVSPRDALKQLNAPSFFGLLAFDASNMKLS